MKRKLRILFQEPLVPRSVTYGVYSSAAGNNTFPYGLASMARYIHEQGHEVVYLDPNIENISLETYASYIQSQNFDVVGIGSTTLQVGHAFKIFDIVKQLQPSLVTVLGGIHATLNAEQSMQECKNIDYIITGEAEKPFSRLLDRLSAGNTAPAENIAGCCYRDKDGNIICNSFDINDRLSIDEIRVPLYEIFPMRKYEAQITFAKVFPSYTILASRGCPFSCSFCNASDILGKKARFRNISSILSEIKILKEEYGMRGILFLDSIFTVNRKWTLDFCQAYEQSGMNLPWSCNSRVDTIDKELAQAMRKAGCWSISFGIESGNQKSLDLINKKVTVEQNRSAVALCLELGLYVYTSYILCLPGETYDDALNTIEFARDLGNQMALFYLPIPFPKTKLREQCQRTGIVREDARYEDYNAWDYQNPIYINPLIGKDNMQKLLRFAFVRFYSSPSVLFKNFIEFLFLKQSPYKFYLGAKALLAILKTR